MAVEVQWTEDDADTGERRFVMADWFACKWRFRARARRREDWQAVSPTPAMWAELLDGLERRLQRGDGVSEADVVAVRKRVEKLASRDADL